MGGNHDDLVFQVGRTASKHADDIGGDGKLPLPQRHGQWLSIAAMDAAGLKTHGMKAVDQVIARLIVSDLARQTACAGFIRQPSHPLQKAFRSPVLCQHPAAESHGRHN